MGLIKFSLSKKMRVNIRKTPLSLLSLVQKVSVFKYKCMLTRTSERPMMSLRIVTELIRFLKPYQETGCAGSVGDIYNQRNEGTAKCIKMQNRRESS